jgi:cellulose biosynthesis protein BcsQ
MYITTLYSFKGGVGRTQALVNVGAELVRRGQRVLLVDFDLEAPGIDSFNLPRPQETTPGIVEFVSEYIKTGAAPDASRFMYESAGVAAGDGRMWIMPAGRQDSNYARQLAGINWDTLYSTQDGYLLFEDLKLQWQQILSPDYVLIDSRTGHTDIAGICTRQLPDGVVVMFFPTDQNLRGLPKIVDDIRSERSRRGKSIHLHFVMSNVPDLDDEDRILESRMRAFEQALAYQQLAETIHRYDSLALLNQVVFTLDRPNSRLAREYRALTDAIVQGNVADRAGALKFLADAFSRSPNGVWATLTREQLEEKLNGLHRAHVNDGAVLNALAAIRMRDGQFDEARGLLNDAEAAGEATAELWLRRAECRIATNDRDGAAADLKNVFQSRDAEDFQISRAFRLMKQVDPGAVREISQTPAVRSLDVPSRLWIAQQLSTRSTDYTAAREILDDVLDSSIDNAVRRQVREQLGFILIGLREFTRAAELLSDANLAEIHNLFNLAMAVWGRDGVPPRELFEAVVASDARAPNRHDANYMQCLALAFGVLGDSGTADDYLARAVQQVMSSDVPVISCWRYDLVSSELFIADVNEMRNYLTAGSPIPRIIAPVERG